MVKQNTCANHDNTGIAQSLDRVVVNERKVIPENTPEDMDVENIDDDGKTTRNLADYLNEDNAQSVVDEFTSPTSSGFKDMVEYVATSVDNHGCRYINDQLVINYIDSHVCH